MTRKNSPCQETQKSSSALIPSPPIPTPLTHLSSRHAPFPKLPILWRNPHRQIIAYRYVGVSVNSCLCPRAFDSRTFPPYSKAVPVCVCVFFLLGLIERMKIFVKTLKGTHFEIEVKPEDTVIPSSVLMFAVF